MCISQADCFASILCGSGADFGDTFDGMVIGIAEAVHSYLQLCLIHYKDII